MDIADRIKHRQIHFRDLHPERNDARTAAQFLDQAPGIVRVTPVTPLLLEVSYDILATSLEEIETALIELGLHLDNGLIYALKRALHYYTERTLRENLGAQSDDHLTKRVFAQRYERLEHGCRDPRPEHWRRYL